MQTRDAHLDFLRGCAILLVVLGHFLQRSPGFDEVLGFRIIYAFHMPLFMVICGMTAALALSPRFTSATALNFSAESVLSLLPGKALRLLLPFFAWAIVVYFLKDPPRPAFASYLFEIVLRPDLALWFLPVLFCIYTAVAISHYVYRVSLATTAGHFAIPLLMMGLLISWLALFALNRSYMLSMTSLYFPFFCAGLIFSGISPRKLSSLEWRSLALVSVLVFIVVLPFWHRTSVDPRLLDWFGARHSATIRVVVAAATSACGVLAFLTLAHKAKALEDGWFHGVICYLGKRTLPIYAMHLLFMSAMSNFLAVPFAIAASLGVDWLLQQSPWTRMMFLGEIRRGEASTSRFVQYAKPWR